MKDNANAVSFARLFILTIGLLGVAGCGSGEKIASVSGTVTHQGQPVPGLVISFVPEGATEAGVSTGETDDNGKYSLTVVKTGASGAVVGKHRVWVSVPRPAYVEKDSAGDESTREARAKARKQGTKKGATKSFPTEMAGLLKTYGRLDDSPLHVEVKDGSPIDLKLD